MSRRARALLGPPPVVTRGRDPRIDMFRGLALLMIYVNHVPGTVYASLTTRNFGFSDAAEAFVFLSGLSAGLAYTDRFALGFWPALARVWARARQIYFVHLLLSVLLLAMFSAAALWFERPQVLDFFGVPQLFQHPLQALVGLPLMTYQLGYVDILPTYVVLMLAAPFLILLARRLPWVLLGVSVAGWVLACELQVNLPTYPEEGGWLLDPFAWQLIFVIGLLCGVARRQGRTFFPRRPALLGVCLALVVIVVCWVRIGVVGEAADGVLADLDRLGVPWYLLLDNKPYLSLPRLLHALALIYLVAGVALGFAVARSRWTSPLRLMGRQSLPTFATLTVASLAIQVVRTGLTRNDVRDGALLLVGLLAMLALAWALDRLKSTGRDAPPDRVTSGGPEAVAGVT